MSYEDFMQEILGYIGESGIKSKVFFDNNEEKKMFEAKIPDEGISFFGRPSGLSLTVRFGSGHQAMVPVAPFS